MDGGLLFPLVEEVELAVQDRLALLDLLLLAPHLFTAAARFDLPRLPELDQLFLTRDDSRFAQVFRLTLGLFNGPAAKGIRAGFSLVEAAQLGRAPHPPSQCQRGASGADEHYEKYAKIGKRTHRRIYTPARPSGRGNRPASPPHCYRAAYRLVHAHTLAQESLPYAPVPSAVAWVAPVPRFAGGSHRRISTPKASSSAVTASEAALASNSSFVIWSAARMAAFVRSTTVPVEPRITCRIARSTYSATARVCSGGASLRIAYSSPTMFTRTRRSFPVIVRPPDGPPRAPGPRPAAAAGIARAPTYDGPFHPPTPRVGPDHDFPLRGPRRARSGRRSPARRPFRSP